jgi:DNA-binding NarL/FixJ family response regulator
VDTGHDEWVKERVAKPELTSSVLLSNRQETVLRLISKGLSNKAIARELGLAESTVKVHINNLFKALKVNNRVEAVARAGWQN